MLRMTAEIIDLCENRIELRHQKNTSHESRTEYQKANREVRTTMKEAKEEWIKE
ncbi:hypothetical protein DPMN_100879 [Dreissena polymorpha]|uniref:Uncharacterized protein n=1 Tax=Dreissena polymorpha TaxID=45954 RepID=A0A9D4LI36_DREPO|nr:hypothetical protein DPMN_100879 [Dreissena polymorpha]